MVAALQRIATVTVIVESRASGYQNALAARPAVERPFEESAPGLVLVNFVEDPQFACRQFASQDPLPVFGDVPVQVAGGGTGKALRKRGLADLAWPGDKNHLSLEIAPDLRQQIAGSAGHYRSVPLLLP